MVLALLKIRPVPSDMGDIAHLCSPLPVNGRRYLKNPKMTRYGCCQAGAVVQFPNLASWSVDENDPDAVKDTLERGCKHVKECYDSWLKNDYQVAVNVAKDNFLAGYLSRSAPGTSLIVVHPADTIDQCHTNSQKFKHSGLRVFVHQELHQIANIFTGFCQ